MVSEECEEDVEGCFEVRVNCVIEKGFEEGSGLFFVLFVFVGLFV